MNIREKVEAHRQQQATNDDDLRWVKQTIRRVTLIDDAEVAIIIAASGRPVFRVSAIDDGVRIVAHLTESVRKRSESSVRYAMMRRGWPMRTKEMQVLEDEIDKLVDGDAAAAGQTEHVVVTSTPRHRCGCGAELFGRFTAPITSSSGLRLCGECRLKKAVEKNARFEIHVGRNRRIMNKFKSTKPMDEPHLWEAWSTPAWDAP